MRERSGSRIAGARAWVSPIRLDGALRFGAAVACSAAPHICHPRVQHNRACARAYCSAGPRGSSLRAFLRTRAEEALRELRRKNENNMARAMASLRGEAASTTALPAVYAATRSAQNLAVRRPPRRKQPGFSRPQTPSEVRDAAEREMSERDQAQHRQPQHRPPQHRPHSKQAHKPRKTQPSGHAADGDGISGGGSEQVPMHDESQARFSLLDWQKQCRSRGVESTDILKVQPRGMFDKVREGTQEQHTSPRRAHPNARALPPCLIRAGARRRGM